MSYTNQMPKHEPAWEALDMVQAAETVLATYTVPDGERFVLQEVQTTVTTAAGDTTSAAVSVGKGTSTDFVELIKTTGLGISAAKGTTTRDKVASVENAGVITTNEFKPGDVLEFRVGTAATTTGKVDITLIIGRYN